MSSATTLLNIPAERWRAPEEAVRRRLTAASYVSSRHRYVYVSTPKVACTSMKTFIHRIERLPPMPPLMRMETRRSMAIHGRGSFALPSLFSGISAGEAAQALADPSFFRFAFVRNPYARLYSAWRDKVHLVEPGYEPVVEAVRAAFPAEVPGDIVPWEPFARWVCGDPKGTSPHWMHQVALLFPDAISYDMIGRLEHFEHDFARFAEHLRRQGAADPDLTAGHLNRRSDGDWRAAYTEALADQVHAHYREDFERFGYERESWRAAGGPPRAVDPALTIRRLEEEIFERNRVIAMLWARREPSDTARALRAHLQARAEAHGSIEGAPSPAPAEHDDEPRDA
jgi:hypothetical protein